MKEYPVEDRFGKIIAQEMWGIVPYALYEYQKALKLSNSEVWFLAWLIMHKWEDDDPFPSISALGRYTGRSRVYIQKIARELSQKGLLQIKKRFLENGARASNFYEVQPLLDKLEKLIVQRQKLDVKGAIDPDAEV